MKRILSILLTMTLCFTAVYAQDKGDEYDDDYVYKQNDEGDQFFKLNLGAFFPLNFGDKLYVGIDASIGYYRFINSWCAIGGDVSVTDNISIGQKILVTVPVTFGAMFQPTIGKFEFPITLTAGIGVETWQNQTYFPSFAAKGTIGAYYRLAEGWSFGISSSFFWIPQWYADSSKNFDGLFLNADIGARYHF